MTDANMQTLAEYKYQYRQQKLTKNSKAVIALLYNNPLGLTFKQVQVASRLSLPTTKAVLALVAKQRGDRYFLEMRNDNNH